MVLKHYFRPGREGFRQAILSAMPEMLGEGARKSAVEEAREILRGMTAKTWRKDRERVLRLLPSGSGIKRFGERDERTGMRHASGMRKRIIRALILPVGVGLATRLATPARSAMFLRDFFVNVVRPVCLGVASGAMPIPTGARQRRSPARVVTVAL